ncbi:putative DNA repair protein MutK [Catenuloplanes atrovinosus]|uniref:DNA repair protein MutK n=1 Tax=Catenuloplanes atrovinosus TaxID=137266 RepID=A0AAE3YP61_9ACTN|nr:putative DNA repair protein MutK [Catenuloplanes atrovinosus]
MDDIAVLARAASASIDDVGVAAAKAGSKAAGVVIDDAAVTPQYVRGLAADRELPIIKRIALGSLGNKAIIIVVALLLSQFVPWLLTPILMLGGAYLCYEGAEKVWAKVSGHGAHGEDEQLKDEKTLISGAIRTDLILSAEIMVISLNEVAEQSFVSRLVILCVVAVLMTVAVYGAVAIIVKMDDVGLRLSERSGTAVAALGRGLVKAMPKVLTVLTIVGTAAMLWVGGHILLVGSDELGLHAVYGAVHHIEEAAHHATGPLGGVVGWLVNTIASAIVGLIIGAVIVVIMTFTFHRAKHGSGAHGDGHGTTHAAPATDASAAGTGTSTATAAGVHAAAGANPAAGTDATAGANAAPAADPAPATDAAPGTDPAPRAGGTPAAKPDATPPADPAGA